MMLFSISLFPFPFFLHRPSSIVPGPGSGSHLFSCSWAKKQQTTVRSWEATYSTYCRYVPTSTYCSKNVSEAKQDEINNRVPARPPITASQTARATFSTSGTGFGINPRSSPFLRSTLMTKTRTFSAKHSPANCSKTTVFVFKAGNLPPLFSCSDQDVGIPSNAELDRQVRA